MSDTEHFVQFYETDLFLIDSLSGFIGAGLSCGEACIVVATRAHREDLEERLRGYGLDPFAAAGQYLALDADEVLAQILLDGSPDPERFAEVVGNAIRRLSDGRRRVRIFGEMVALLWAEGNFDAALKLEGFWNDLRHTCSFALYCAYPMNRLGGEVLSGPLSQVCQSHSRLIPAESYTALPDTAERLRAIVLLQQKAESLEAQIEERRQAEDALQSAKEELEAQVEDLRRLHEMSIRLTSTLEIESVLEEVLRAALAVHGTDLGLLSMCDLGRTGLTVKVQSGFDEEFLKQIEWVPPGAGACGACLEQRRRVVVEDVMVDPLFARYRESARRAGLRAAHSTPLITRGGDIIGVLSVHFRHPYRPSERETYFMDLYARMAADTIENARLHRQVQEELERREHLLIRERTARTEAENASRLKDEFLATVSHELRTPLNAILGWAHMLRRGDLDQPAASRAVETIDRNARAQAQLIEDILDVSRVIRGKLRLNIGPVDLSSVINAAIDAVQLAASAKGIQLEVNLDPSARRLSGDASRLQQVVWNLLSNAIKFTDPGGRVDVRLERVGVYAQVKVIDTGAGISADFLPYIFDRFRQADGSTTRRSGGLGLGLAIVRHLVELHGGWVRAESEGEGCGSTFIIQLPLAEARPLTVGQRSEPERAWAIRDAEAGLSHLPSLEGVQVLLVDDDRDTLQMLTFMLTEYKATVQVAASVHEAFELLEWYQPDVLVSDLAMPDEDGYSLISRLREREAGSGKQTPAVALTAYVRVEDRARALASGFNMFVPKPVELTELITAVANLAEPGPSAMARQL